MKNNKHIHSFSEHNEKLNISDVTDTNQTKKEWWEKNYQKLIDLNLPYETLEDLVNNTEEFEALCDSTSKDIALYLLDMFSISELEDLIETYS